MSRGVALDGVALPVTDGAITYTRQPIAESSILGRGDDVLYNGLYTDIKGSFGGAFRPEIVGPLIDDILADQPATHSLIVIDDWNNSLSITNAYISVVEVSVKAGELVKFSTQLTAKNVGFTESMPAKAPDFASTVVPFYYTNPPIGASAFTIRIERPYAADEFILSYPNSHMNYNSEYIYDKRAMKISGTITLSQTAPHFMSWDSSMVFGLDANTIIVTEPVFLTSNEINISGRNLINKTINWSCKSTSIIYTE